MTTRAEYLAYAIRLSGHIARLNRRLTEALEAGLANGLPAAPKPMVGVVQGPLTYSPEAKCPGCGEVVPQDERLCPKCGIREGDPEQR